MLQRRHTFAARFCDVFLQSPCVQKCDAKVGLLAAAGEDKLALGLLVEGGVEAGAEVMNNYGKVRTNLQLLLGFSARLGGAVGGAAGGAAGGAVGGAAGGAAGWCCCWCCCYVFGRMVEGSPKGCPQAINHVTCSETRLPIEAPQAFERVLDEEVRRDETLSTRVQGVRRR